MRDDLVPQALEAAYRFITQPLRMESPRDGIPTATYDARPFNKLVEQMRDALDKSAA